MTERGNLHTRRGLRRFYTADLLLLEVVLARTFSGFGVGVPSLARNAAVLGCSITTTLERCRSSGALEGLIRPPGPTRYNPSLRHREQ